MSNTQVEIWNEENSSQNAPKYRTDSCWSWLVCFAGTISVIIVTGLSYCFGLLLPTFMEIFQATRQETAWIGSLYISSGCILYPIGCYLTSRFGYRFAAALGSVAGIIGFTLASFSSKLWMLYITYGILSGFGFVMVYNSSFLVVLQYFVKWRSLAISILASGPAVGVFALSQLTQGALSTFGWQWTVRGFSVLYFVTGVCSILFVPLDDQGQTSKIKETTNHKEKGTSLLRNRSFLIFLTSITVIHLVVYVPHVHIIKYCSQELHIPASKSSKLYTYYAIAAFIGRHLFCKLGDFRFINRFHLYQVGMTLCGMCLVCLPFARTFSSLVAIFLVNGLLEGSMFGQWSLMVYDCVGRNKVNQAFGYLTFFIGVASAIGPSLAGLMADKLGSYDPAFYTSGAVQVVGASMTCLIAFTQQQSQEVDEDTSLDEFLYVTEKVTVL
ncbi:monocarboxylate transporter 10-like [Montipora capricornis]|uniref:monocarboxylate transporter 10-like n=1 Tax=Montipora foliosa TaxID=591990 RepID=UPI0035F21409